MSENPSGVKYEFEVELDNPNNGHAQVHRLVSELGPSLSVLEVGCSSGYVGATLVAKGHRVTGIEPDPVSAEAARTRLHEVHAGGIETFLDAAGERRYDAITFGDVLEHLQDPAAALRRCVPLLSPDGAIVASLPCATHGSIRAMLLGGRWDYADYGLLDRTHLHFYSRDGVAELMTSAGLAIDRMVAVVQPVDEVARLYGMQLRPEAIAAVEALATDEDLLTFQFVLRARRAATDPADLLERNRRVPVEPAIPLPRIPGERSLLQQLRRSVLRRTLAAIARRRFRGRSDVTSA